MAKVTLLSHTPHPEQNIAAAAKLCYSSSSIDQVMEGLTDENTASFVQMLADIGHQSPIEHITFTFGIEGVSRALLAQITRHRIASFSVQSQRYVPEAAFTFVVPPHIEKIPAAKQEFLDAMQQAQQHYNHLADLLEEQHIKTLCAEGKPLETARKMAKKMAIEDARFVLPNACDTKMIVTMNARSLLHFFELRCCRRAQWEIREVAVQMLTLAKQAAPHVFSKAGPGCVCGPCPEGKMSCGHMQEVREFFQNLEAQP